MFGIYRLHSGRPRLHYRGTLEHLLVKLCADSMYANAAPMTRARACGIEGTIDEVTAFFAAGGKRWGGGAYYLVQEA